MEITLPFENYIYNEYYNRIFIFIHLKSFCTSVDKTLKQLTVPW